MWILQSSEIWNCVAGAQVSKHFRGTSKYQHQSTKPHGVIAYCNIHRTHLLVYICDHNIIGYVQKLCHQTMMKDSPISNSYTVLVAQGMINLSWEGDVQCICT